VTFSTSVRALHHQWMQTIEDQLHYKAVRPHSLLVFINPVAAIQQAVDIYQFKVAPLFKLAKITTVVIVTDYANHARDYILATDFHKYDGVVCVGGDGMFSELMQGVIRRTQTKAGVDLNNPKARLAKCHLRIGIIPAGSTNSVCYSTTGVSDPVTSALHIIVGDCQPLDVCSVHQRNTLLKYSASLLGYGFFGDILKDAERARWLRASRYDLSGIKTFLKHQLYEGNISFRLATGRVGSPRDKCRCLTGCTICSEIGRRLNQNENEDDNANWNELEGKFLAINGACISCCSFRSSQGLSPSGHLANGALDLILVHKCSKFNFLRHLFRHVTNNDQLDFPFVEVYRVREFKFLPYVMSSREIALKKQKRKSHFRRNIWRRNVGRKSSSWNSDGELIMPAAIEVK
uniref:Ceramide kinase-like n=1 Tax=Callorhinchus milii TaxID=7868 RepID=A0A4W3GMH5_CALMI